MPTKMSLEGIANNCHAISTSKGFWDEKVDIHFLLSKLALVHSEVSETLEALRKQKGSNNIAEEICDILIRVLDFYSGAKMNGWIDQNTSIDDIFDIKMSINSNRPIKHGNLA